MQGDVGTGAGVVPAVLREHLREAGLLHAGRATVVISPAANLSTLARHDERLTAHLDGLLVAGDDGAALCRELQDAAEDHEHFPVAVVMLQRGDVAAFEQLLREGAPQDDIAAGLRDALAWVHPRHVRDVVTACRRAERASHRLAAIEASVAHDADPRLAELLDDEAPAVRARALRAAGEQGRTALAARCLTAAGDDSQDCRFWGAWSAVLLGSQDALPRLEAFAAEQGPHQTCAFRLALQRASLASGHARLQQLARDPTRQRWVIQGSGLVGDPKYLPWLIAQMATPEMARLAGEAFANITGLDLFHGFEVARPEGFESGPSEDPEDERIDLDPDEGLPWPDVPKIQAWWATNGVRFQPGQRYFIGGTIAREHCVHVLKHGYQRQRILAAHYLCLLGPGTPLFRTMAPAWRQQRLLAQV